MQGTYGRSHRCYCEPLITRQMKTSGSPFEVKIGEKKIIIQFTIWVNWMILCCCLNPPQLRIIKILINFNERFW